MRRVGTPRIYVADGWPGTTADMSFDFGSTLGNQRFVARVPVQYFATGETQADVVANETTELSTLAGGGTAALVPRGRVLCVSSKGDDTVAVDMSAMTRNSAKQLFRPGQRTFGVIAEAMADNVRRVRRLGGTPVDYVLPVTFQGIDIVTAPCVTVDSDKSMTMCDEFAPGDSVYATFGSEGADRGYRLTKKPDKVSIRMGVCHVGTKGESEVQVMIDSMSSNSIYDYN